jgi:GH15 family glucan-1,4-alpha-glucosidase
LKGLTYAPTGALVAAPTTSLPETPGGVRNWDDRYTWVRDSTFALWALYTFGLDREADDLFAFIRDVAAEDDLQVMYGIDGEKDLPEVTVEGPGGYDGARPVRIGNAAAHQRLIDIWGIMLDSVYLHAKSRGQLPEPLWPVLMCWVALDRGARLARLHGEADYVRKWDTVAEEIHEDICRSGVDDRGVFVQSYGTTEFLSESPPVRKLVAMVPTPRCDHRENELPALVQQSLVNARVVLADRLGNVSEIELDGSTAARLPRSSDWRRCRDG